MDMKMDTNYTIYCHRNKINNKAYIGQTGCVPYTRRQSGHGVSGSPYEKCRHFQNAIIKYGQNNFEHFILMENLTLEQANHYEKLFIKMFETNNPIYGYNISLGGGNSTHSEETKQLISLHHADFSKEKHPLQGKHHSEETKQKIREKALGRKKSKETKQKISEKTKGSNNPRAKTVLCLETQQIFSTAKEAAKQAKVDNSGICKCCNGHQKTCGIHPETGEKLHQQYINEIFDNK